MPFCSVRIVIVVAIWAAKWFIRSELRWYILFLFRNKGVSIIWTIIRLDGIKLRWLPIFFVRIKVTAWMIKRLEWPKLIRLWLFSVWIITGAMIWVFIRFKLRRLPFLPVWIEIVVIDWAIKRRRRRTKWWWIPIGKMCVVFGFITWDTRIRKRPEWSRFPVCMILKRKIFRCLHFSPSNISGFITFYNDLDVMFILVLTISVFLCEILSIYVVIIFLEIFLMVARIIDLVNYICKRIITSNIS